ncbi:dTDP-4-dehydrorhamnose 3,5-epimerase [Anaerocolumna cellulosilytica]|uniref:dTDP-4-dehydrorhamnose 3,5-epimerase n=1 Tax=Anaerocolumna cellulosilytica TaxID=433286 RepID=A0A6S6R192_9FIRM|nr:dTDP-4-dehydrorhamnose 3,5-epimerase [Anaerocolumna cellulosilytica]MBB5194369.1 dTDP-4-dehydrorhamnose 3,5-epimerase [Anaerocolumna cellulosilytica]BCJ93312.1 dTDP-4-dehydrorhamnose 3,5-epimerase [Anaerocolumna cellulosilytica]
MGQFKFTKGSIEGLYVIEPICIGDNRGYFMETYNYDDFKKAGLDMVFVQDNQSLSKKGVLRGLHFQKKHPQGKLVRVIKGEVFDVAVDIRPGSKTYGRWQGEILTEDNRKQFYVPKGFAHGFLVLSEEAEFAYKCTDFYYPEDQDGIQWNDPALAIEWSLKDGMEPILADKDKISQGFADLKRQQSMY